MQQPESDARDSEESELTCVQSDQRMHGQGFGYLLAQNRANVQGDPTLLVWGEHPSCSALASITSFTFYVEIPAVI